MSGDAVADATPAAACVHPRADSEVEPLDPDTDYSDGTSENILLASQSYLHQLSDKLTAGDGSRPQTLPEARETYRTELRESSESEYYCDRKKRADQHYNKLLQTDRFKLAEYDTPYTVMLSLRVDPVVDGVRIPTVNLFEAVKATWPSIRQKLRYQLTGCRDDPLNYEYAVVVAGTDHWATPHLHIYVWVDGHVNESDFRPVVDTFVDKCDYAPDDGTGNRVEGRAVTIRRPDTQEFATDEVRHDLLDSRGPATAGAHYVASQLPHISHPEDATESELLHGATTVAAPSNAVHFSRGCWTEGDGEVPPTIDDSDVLLKNFVSVKPDEPLHPGPRHLSSPPDRDSIAKQIQWIGNVRKFKNTLYSRCFATRLNQRPSIHPRVMPERLICRFGKVHFPFLLRS
jgi:hypothetical protein